METGEKKKNPQEHCSLRVFIGWGTWIRTKTNGVRVRSSTIKLSPIKISYLFRASRFR